VNIASNLVLPVKDSSNLQGSLPTSPEVSRVYIVFVPSSFCINVRVVYVNP